MGGDASKCKCCSALKDDDLATDSMPGVAVSQMPNMPEHQATSRRPKQTEHDDPKQLPDQSANVELPQSAKRQPATELRVKLNREGRQATLGVDVAFDDEETSFYIEKMYDGLVKTWNNKNPDQKVEEGDHVVEVNGISGSAMDMVEASRRDDIVEIVIRRPDFGRPDFVP
uniref:PDZ domain-containing protein n=1 Tax=Noctiluca scintillans TaxID=2966 RepID=A0A7S1A3G0_NOCSC